MSQMWRFYNIDFAILLFFFIDDFQIFVTLVLSTWFRFNFQNPFFFYDTILQISLLTLELSMEMTNLYICIFTTV